MTSRSPFRATPDHAAATADARATRGSWVLASIYPSSASAKSAAQRAKTAERMPAYQPAGAYEAYAAPHDDGHALWIRYVAGSEPVPPLPDTMTVRVIDRGPGRGYIGLTVVTVTISALCTRCGGPRGTARAHRFHEDGEWYTCDRWTNTCGHIDRYEVVLREARAEGGVG